MSGQSIDVLVTRKVHLYRVPRSSASGPAPDRGISRSEVTRAADRPGEAGAIYDGSDVAARHPARGATRRGDHHGPPGGRHLPPPDRHVTAVRRELRQV